MVKSLILFLVIWLCIHPYQLYSTYKKELTTNNGLPNIHIKGIGKDEFGFIWIGTENGLVRYDGSDLKTYDISQMFNDYLSENRIVWLLEASNHQVYFEIIGGKRFQAKGSEIIPLGEEESRHLAVVCDNSSFFNARLTTLKLENGTSFKNYRSDYKGAVFTFLNGKEFVPASKFNFSKSSNDLNSFFRLTANDLYFFNNQFNLYKFRTNDYIKVDYNIKDLPSFSNLKYFRTYWNYNTGSALMRVNEKVYNIRDNNGKIEFDLITDQLSEQCDIYLMYFDEANNLLLVTSHFGINEYRDLYKSNTALKLLKTGGECEILQVDKDLLYTQNGKFVDLNGRIVKRLPNFESVFVYSSFKSTKALYTTGPAGVFYASLRDKFKFNKFDTSIKDEVKVAFYGRDNRLWVFNYSKGLYIYELNPDGSKKSLYIINPSILKASKFMFNQSSVWVFTQDGTVYEIDFNNHKSRMILKDERISVLRFAFKLDDGKVLCASYGAGLYIIDNNHRLLPLNPDKKNYTRFSSCIIERSPGYLLVTTNYGIIEIEARSVTEYYKNRNSLVKYRYYDGSNGLPVNEFNGGCSSCGTILSNGMIALPSISGILMIDNKFFDQSILEPKIHIDEILINQRFYSKFDSSTYILTDDPDLLSVKFSIPYFGYREDIMLELWLNGVKINASNVYYKENYLEISGLVPGDNVVEIVANNRGVVSKVNFIVSCPYPWYSRWQYWLLIAELLFLAVFLVVWLYNKNLIRKNRELDRVIKERTRVIQNNLLDINKKNTELNRLMRHKNNIVSMMSHDIFGPLKFCSIVLDDVSSKVTPAEVHTSIEEVSDSIKRIMGMSKDVLYWSYSQNDQNKLSMGDVDLMELVIDKTAYFNSIYKNKAIKFKFNKISVVVYTEKNILLIALGNLIENAIKYGKSRTIKIEYGKIDREAFVRVTNDGSDIPDALMESINKQLYIQQFDNKEIYSNGGIGLRITIELLSLVKGVLRIEKDMVLNTTSFYLILED